MAWPKSRCSGCERPRWRQSRSPVALPGPSRDCAGHGRIGLQVLVDFVADLAFEGSQRFFGGLALGHFLVVIGAAVAVTLADLGDRGHVHGVVEAPAPRQPVDLAIAGRHPGRRSAVAGSEAVPAGEPVSVTGLADDDGSDDRSSRRRSR